MRYGTPFLAVASALALLAAAAPTPTLASSHSEAPGTSKDRLADDTDLYAWVANDAPGAVTIVGDWVPLIEPNSGPNFASFDDDATYYINVDNAGDAHKHIRFEFKFKTTRQTDATFLYNTGVVNHLGDGTLNVRQDWTLNRIDVTYDAGGNPTEHETPLGSGRVAPAFVGPASMPDYAGLAREAIATLPGGYKVFVGPRDDPFFVDIAAIFDLLTIRRPPGNRGRGVDGVGGFDVMSIVIQIPKDKLTRGGMAPDKARNTDIIGIWDTAERPRTRVINGDGTLTNSGDEMQVSRLGMPLVNEVVIPLAKKDLFNASEPFNDLANFASFIVHPELPQLLHLLHPDVIVPGPAVDRNDLVAVFATGVPGLNQPAGVTPGEMLRINMTIPPAALPNRLGVLAGDLAGFPNGRRLTDDVVDIEERVAAGVLVPGFNNPPANQLGDGIDANDMPFLPYFPYVAPPQNPFDHEHHPEQHGASAASSGRMPGDGASEDGRTSETAGAAPPSAEMSLASQNPGARAVLQYTLPGNARVSLRVYDVQGRAVRTLIDQDAAAGTFRATWDGRTDEGAAAGRGVFFARLTADNRLVDTKKIVIQ